MYQNPTKDRYMWWYSEMEGQYFSRGRQKLPGPSTSSAQGNASSNSVTRDSANSITVTGSHNDDVITKMRESLKEEKRRLLELKNKLSDNKTKDEDSINTNPTVDTNKATEANTTQWKELRNSIADEKRRLLELKNKLIDNKDKDVKSLNINTHTTPVKSSVPTAVDTNTHVTPFKSSTPATVDTTKTSGVDTTQTSISTGLQLKELRNSIAEEKRRLIELKNKVSDNKGKDVKSLNTNTDMTPVKSSIPTTVDTNKDTGVTTTQIQTSISTSLQSKKLKDSIEEEKQDLSNKVSNNKDKDVSSLNTNITPVKSSIPTTVDTNKPTTQSQTSTSTSVQSKELKSSIEAEKQRLLQLLNKMTSPMQDSTVKPQQPADKEINAALQPPESKVIDVLASTESESNKTHVSIKTEQSLPISPQTRTVDIETGLSTVIITQKVPIYEELYPPGTMEIHLPTVSETQTNIKAPKTEITPFTESPSTIEIDESVPISSPTVEISEDVRPPGTLEIELPAFSKTQSNIKSITIEVNPEIENDHSVPTIQKSIKSEAPQIEQGLPTLSSQKSESIEIESGLPAIKSESIEVEQDLSILKSEPIKIEKDSLTSNVRQNQQICEQPQPPGTETVQIPTLPGSKSNIDSIQTDETVPTSSETKQDEKSEPPGIENGVFNTENVKILIHSNVQISPGIKQDDKSGTPVIEKNTEPVKILIHSDVKIHSQTEQEPKVKSSRRRIIYVSSDEDESETKNKRLKIDDNLLLKSDEEIVGSKEIVLPDFSRILSIRLPRLVTTDINNTASNAPVPMDTIDLTSIIEKDNDSEVKVLKKPAIKLNLLRSAQETSTASKFSTDINTEAKAKEEKKPLKTADSAKSEVKSKPKLNLLKVNNRLKYPKRKGKEDPVIDVDSINLCETEQQTDINTEAKAKEEEIPLKTSESTTSDEKSKPQLKLSKTNTQLKYPKRNSKEDPLVDVDSISVCDTKQQTDINTEAKAKEEIPLKTSKSTTSAEKSNPKRTTKEDPVTDIYLKNLCETEQQPDTNTDAKANEERPLKTSESTTSKEKSKPKLKLLKNNKQLKYPNRKAKEDLVVDVDSDNLCETEQQTDINTETKGMEEELPPKTTESITSEIKSKPKLNLLKTNKHLKYPKRKAKEDPVIDVVLINPCETEQPTAPHLEKEYKPISKQLKISLHRISHKEIKNMRIVTEENFVSNNIDEMSTPKEIHGSKIVETNTKGEGNVINSESTSKLQLDFDSNSIRNSSPKLIEKKRLNIIIKVKK